MSHSPAGIHNDPCDCPPGQCAHFVNDDAQCINRLRGEVVTANCLVCNPNGNGATWHHNGECLRCRHLGEGRNSPPPPASGPRMEIA